MTIRTPFKTKNRPFVRSLLEASSALFPNVSPLSDALPSLPRKRDGVLRTFFVRGYGEDRQTDRIPTFIDIAVDVSPSCAPPLPQFLKPTLRGSSSDLLLDCPTTSRPSKMSAQAERRNPDLIILVDTPSASSSGPRIPATSLLDLPVEIISEISSYLMHRLDDSNHYFEFQDDSCHQSVTARYRQSVPRDLRRLRQDILSFASTCKVIRIFAMPLAMHRIGFNLCRVQLDQVRGLSEDIKGMVKQIVIHTDDRDHQAGNDDEQTFSFIDFVRPFVNASNLRLTMVPFLCCDMEPRLPGDRLGLEAAADEADRRRQDPDVALAEALPLVTDLSITLLHIDNQPGEFNDPEKLRKLRLLLKQFDLPRLRVFHLNLDELWSFHGDPDGEAPWENLGIALQHARFPALQEFYLALEFEIISLSFRIDICDASELLLCSFQTSRNLRVIKLSITMIIQYAAECVWMTNSKEDGHVPTLRSTVSPTLERLVNLVTALRQAHPQLETFWFSFGTISEPFWEFKYPVSNATEDGAPDEDGGETISSVVDDGRFASFTTYNDNVQDTFFIGDSNHSEWTP